MTNIDRFSKQITGRAQLSSTWCSRTVSVTALLHEKLITPSNDDRPHHAQHPPAPEPYMTDTTSDRERAARRSAGPFDACKPRCAHAPEPRMSVTSLEEERAVPQVRDSLRVQMHGCPFQAVFAVQSLCEASGAHSRRTSFS